MNDIQSKLRPYVNILREKYPQELKKVVLFGSYARGDYKDYSDVDIFLVLDVPEKELSSYEKKIWEITDGYLEENEGFPYLSPIADALSNYRYWKKVMPLYRNIDKEGVILYECT